MAKSKKDPNEAGIPSTQKQVAQGDSVGNLSQQKDPHEAGIPSTQEQVAQGDSVGTRRQRLSRKEQKARKKQKKRHRSRSHSDPSSNKEVTVDSDDKNFDLDYVATPIPTLKDLQKVHGAKPLGKWFPKAVVVKSREPPVSNTKSSLVLFYQYVDPLWPESVTQQLMAFLIRISEIRVLGGRIRVAREGVNATLSSRDVGQQSAAQTLRHFAKDLRSFHAVFEKTDFKFIDNLSGDRHFKDFKVFPVKELVYYGLDGEKAPLSFGGVHLKASDFHEKLKEENTVVVDVRNHYEAAIGRFDGQDAAAVQGGDNTSNNAQGAKYVDPKMRKSTDFANWLEKAETKKELEGKQVLLYCTGGIRCERASAFLNHKMGKEVSGVYQLQGGIERYLKAFPDGGFWRGKNFVFDKRESVGVENADGDGGVVKDSRVTKEKGLLPEMKCCICQKPWDRYVGKKKCGTCGVPVLMCDGCMSSKMNKDEKNLIRCPLCVDENITVKADEVDWTNNGLSICQSKESGKAAPSVLKWGGGHATEKKERRKFRRKPCKFGAACKRPDCFFSHPERDSNS